MSVINGSLLDGIVQFHSSESHAELAALVIDEMDGTLMYETFENSQKRQISQGEVLRFCKQLGCRIIVVHVRKELRAKHIYDIIKEPDFSCLKYSFGLFETKTTPPFMNYIQNNKITSLVVMGSFYYMCVTTSLIGDCIARRVFSGLLDRQITVLSSPELLGPYSPELYPFEPRFKPSAISFENFGFLQYTRILNWPIFTLHPGMRFYTKIR